MEKSFISWDIPDPRYLHNSFMDSEQNLFILGGSSGNSCLSDIWKINIYGRESKDWKKIKGSVGAKKLQNSFIFDDSNPILLFGGFFQKSNIDIFPQVITLHPKKESISSKYNLGSWEWSKSLSEKAFAMQNVLKTLGYLRPTIPREYLSLLEKMMEKNTQRAFQEMIIADQYCIFVINAIKETRSLDSLKDWQVGFSHIFNMATKQVEAEDNILYLEGEIKIFGDIQGDLEGLLKL
jgi:hypothetical protein